MPEVLNQVVVQEQSGPERRFIAQWGESPGDISEQKIISYLELSAAEKVVYDAFIAMVLTK